MVLRRGRFFAVRQLFQLLQVVADDEGRVHGRRPYNGHRRKNRREREPVREERTRRDARRRRRLRLAGVFLVSKKRRLLTQRGMVPMQRMCI